MAKPYNSCSTVFHDCSSGTVELWQLTSIDDGEDTEKQEQENLNEFIVLYLTGYGRNPVAVFSQQS